MVCLFYIQIFNKLEVKTIRTQKYDLHFNAKQLTYMETF